MSEDRFFIPPFPTSREAAAWFEGCARKKQASLSAVKLQCLLYLAQGFYMAENNGSILFPGVFIATDRGPREPLLYRVMDGFFDAEPHEVDVKTQRFLERLWKQFAQRSEEELLTLIGRDRLYAAVMAEAGQGGVIPLPAMDERFAEIVSAARSRDGRAVAGSNGEMKDDEEIKDSGKDSGTDVESLRVVNEPPRRVFDDIARDLLAARQAPPESGKDNKPTPTGPLAIRQWAPKRRIDKAPDISFAKEKKSEKG